MRLNPVDILATWYNDETLPWSAQKAVNYIAETAEVGGTRSVSKVKGLPGLDVLTDLGTDAPIRGAEDVEGTLFVVSGTSLFQIGTDLTVTNRGNIPGVGLVSMAHNKQGGTAAANELVIANGLSGYVYNTDTTVLAQITDDAFPGATTFDYVDGYISFTDPEGRFWGHSALNQATQYSSTDRYDAESAPDKIVSHIVSHREVMVFGTRTTEFFRNTGAATGTFQRVDGTEMEVGIASTLSRARLDNTVYWLGNDGIVYRLAGHSPQRVSTRPIEQAISRFNLVNAFAHTWEDRGHKVFYLTFPDGLTFGFDVATSLWHARETYGLERWGYNTTTKWNGLWVAGHYSDGKLYSLDWDTYIEGALPLVAECCPGVTHADGNDVLCPYVELFMDTGVGGEDTQELTLTGDLSDGILGDIGTYQYLVSGGLGPVTVTIDSGSLPDGATMDENGLVTFAYTVAGTFNWVVKAQDGFGNTATLPDSAVITAAAMMATNLRHYTGPAETMSIAPANIPWLGGVTIDVVSLSPNGQYLIGSDADSLNANRIQFLKYNGLTNTWSVLAFPAVLPPAGPFSASWHPSGEYVAIGFNDTVNRVFVYRRVGDVFTKIAAPVTIQGNQAVWVKWSPDGTKLACSNASTSDNVWVYNFDAGTGVLSGGKGGINTGDQTAALAWVPNQSNRYLIRGNSTNMSLVDTSTGPNMTVVDSVTLAASFSDATGGAWFADDTTLITLGSAFMSNGPVTVWSVIPSAGASAINFVAYPATITTVGAGKRSALKMDGPYFAVARDIAAQASPFVYLVTGTVLTPFSGIPTGATGTVTNVSWRGAH